MRYLIFILPLFFALNTNRKSSGDKTPPVVLDFVSDEKRVSNPIPELSLNWSDRRPIGTIFLASFPGMDKFQPNKYNWIFAQKPDFKTGLLSLADRSIASLKLINVQGGVDMGH